MEKAKGNAIHQINNPIAKVGYHLCRCNWCGAILIDKNPQFDAKQYDLLGNEKKMGRFVDEKGEEFWGCPDCKTDDCLIDL